MQEHHIARVEDLLVTFERDLLQFLQTKSQPRYAITWADMFQDVPQLFQKGMAVEVWANMTLLELALNQGIDVLLADGW